MKTTFLTKHISDDPLSPDPFVSTIQIATPADYLDLLKDKDIAIVANQTSVVERNVSEFTHLVDTLLNLGISIQKVFSPEHGFRGTADAGEHIADRVDTSTGLPLISLYGKNYKPTQAQLADVDLVLFDIQDVGVRFYTYISTLHYVMEACAEAGIPLIVIDRPNPNAHYIDGPILEKEHQSFIGMHPVPLVYGMTIGEYAQMINGEGWLTEGVTCNLRVMPLKNYTHHTPYSLPIKPSPNLPNDVAINLYPSLGLFEGTTVSAGRGTSKQFQLFGSPFLPASKYSYQFTPRPNEGSKSPKFNGKRCYGLDLSNEKRLNKIQLNWLIDAYHNHPKKHKFFIDFLTKLAGTTSLKKQIEDGWSADKISASWQKDLNAFKKMRTPYLLYKE
ncbi:DUF1343 domain-containing protein [Flavobacteriaceae bacterium F08102]|nr:DUF1343 domain-containing protein [Flavobacteriaceae bacterium F08102]